MPRLGTRLRRALKSRSRPRQRRTRMGRMRHPLRGRGAYVRNSLMGNGVPYVANPKIGGDLATQIRHREYLGDIAVTIPAGQTLSQWELVGSPSGYPINPGMNTTFPWLASVAGQYIQYSINGMVVEYITTSGSAVGASSNQSLGSVSLAVQYDSILPPYTSKSQMLNDQSSVSGVPFTNQILGIECAPQQTTLTKQYLRNDVPPANSDIRMYDLGTFYVATDGIQCAPSDSPTTVKLGELWVSYDIILMKASLSLSGGYDPTPGVPEKRVAFNATGSFATNPCAFPTTVWPHTGWTVNTSNTNLTGASLTDDTLTLPPIGGTDIYDHQRYYAIAVNWEGTTTTTVIASQSRGAADAPMDLGVYQPTNWAITNGVIVNSAKWGSDGYTNASGTLPGITINITKLGGVFYVLPTDNTQPVVLTLHNVGLNLPSPTTGTGVWGVNVWVTAI